MTMRVKPKRVELLVKLLRDPNAEFVSIVDHGANQTPFTSLKAAKIPLGERSMTTRKKLRRLPPEEKTSKSAKMVAIRKLVFNSDEFEGEKAVKAWLEDNDWEGYKISKSDSGIEASSPDISDDDFVSIREVEVDKGITGFVGEPKTTSKEETTRDTGTVETVEDDEEEEETKSRHDQRKKPEKKANVKKFDLFGAFLSGGETVADVMKDAMKDGVPPGFDEIVFATTQAMANSMKNAEGSSKDLEEKLIKAGQDLGHIVFGVHKAFDMLIEDDELEDETKAAVIEAKKSWDESFAKSLEGEIISKALIGNVEEIKPEEDEDDSVQTSATDGDPMSDLAASIGELKKSFVNGMSDLRESIEKANELAEEAKSTASAAAEKVAKLSSKAPTKKAASEGASDDPDTSEEDETVVKFERRLTRNMIGV